MSRLDQACEKYGPKVFEGLNRDYTFVKALKNALANSEGEERAVYKEAFDVLDEVKADMLLTARLTNDVVSKQDLDEFLKPIVTAFAWMTDPTAKRNNGSWKYLDWIGKAYLKSIEDRENILCEDFYKLKDDLRDLEAFKNNLDTDRRSIDSYKSYRELLEVLAPLQQKRDEKKMKRGERKIDPEQLERIMSNTTIVYDGPEGQIVVPQTAEASIYWGQGTRWCTAATGSWNYFDNYNDKEPLWLYLTKPTDEEREIDSGYQSFKYTGTAGHLYDEMDNSNIYFLPPYLSRLIDAALDNAEPNMKRFLKKFGSYRGKPALNTDRLDQPKQQKALKQALARSNGALAYVPKLPEDLRSDRKFMYRLAAINPNVLKFADEALTSDRDFMMKMVTRRGLALAYASDELKNDKELVRRALEPDRRFSRFVNALLAPARAIVDHAPRQTGMYLESASDELKGDASLFIYALWKGYQPDAFPHALRDDKKAAKAWVLNGLDCNALPDNMKANRSFVKWALRVRPTSFAAATAMHNDRKLTLMALRRNGNILRELPLAVKSDKEMVRAAVKATGTALQFADEKFTKDKEVVMDAVRSDGSALRYACPELKKEWDVVVAAFGNTAKAVVHAPLEYRCDTGARTRGWLRRNWRRAGAPVRGAVAPFRWGAQLISDAMEKDSGADNAPGAPDLR